MSKASASGLDPEEVHGVTLGTVVATSESAGDVSRESKQTRPDTAKQRRESE